MGIDKGSAARIEATVVIARQTPVRRRCAELNFITLTPRE
jgi:hypothetical protein